MAQRFMLVPSMEGISREFVSGAKQWHNVNIRTPIQFFDTPFKDEESPTATSVAVSALKKRGSSSQQLRVPQPYSMGDGRQRGDDLLPYLLDKISRRDEGKSIHVIVGPAGIGKTVLFESLFTRLLADFLEDKAKSRLTPRPRPLPLVPEYLRSAVAPTVRALVDAFLATDFATPISRGVFEWMITNGFGVWLLDGLDEVIARDPDFFEYLLELLTKPGGLPPRIVVCVRDSLLATNDDINDFREEYGNVVEIYELAKWEMQSKRRFATLFLREQADDFIRIVSERAEVSELSSTPYYCRLLAEQFKSGALKDSYTESELLADATSSIINREYDKGLLDRDLLPEKTIVELLEGLAAENMEGGYQGLQRDAIEEWARIILPSDLTQSDLQRLVTNIIQLALFAEGSVTGNVQFAQEILERFLLGAFLNRRLRGDMASFVRTLAVREIPAEWVTLKVVANEVRTEKKLGAIVDQSHEGLSRVGFKNLVQIGALAATEPKALAKMSFDRKDLSGVKFDRLDFTGVSFRASDLTDVEFSKCVLRSTIFEEAIIKNTSFVPRERGDLAGAKFGGMERFYSLRTEAGKLMVDREAVRKWIKSSTGAPVAIINPCPSALQLRHMFSKFVYPDGTARRAMLDERGVLSGKRYIDPEAVLKGAVKYGYLTREDRFGRIKRPDGDLYAELVSYVKDFEISPGIRSLLADICPLDDCPHIPAT